MIKLTCKKKRGDDISRWLVSTGDRSWRPHCCLSVTPSVCLSQSVAMSVNICVYIDDTVANVAAAAAVNLEKFSINDVDRDWLVRSSPRHQQPGRSPGPPGSFHVSLVLCLNVRVFARFRFCVLQSTANRRRHGAQTRTVTTAPLPELSSWLVALRFSNRGTRW